MYKTPEHRDATVAAVNAAAKQWPTLLDLPVGYKGDAKIVTVPVDGRGYVATLYEVCARGGTPVGRTEDGGSIICADVRKK